MTYRSGVRVLKSILQERFRICGLKQIDSWDNTEVPSRVVVLGCAAALATWLFDDPIILAFGGVYLTVFLTYLWWIQTLDDEVSSRVAAVVFVSLFVVLFILTMAAAYLWTVHGMTGRIFAMMLMVGAMMNCLALRSRETFYLIADVFGIGLGFFVLIGLTLQDGITAQNVGIALTLACGYGYFVMAGLDVSRTRAKLIVAQSQEVERARLEAIGRLTGGVAHDFNNLLTVIRGNLELRRVLQRQGGSLIEAEHLVREAEEAADRAACTTNQLLAYSRKSVLQPRAASLQKIAQDMERLLQSTLPAPISLNLCTAPETSNVLIDVAKVENVILNLVLNARDAMPDGGTVTLRVQPRLSDTSGAPRDCVVVCVEDTGQGIPKEIIDRVTEPYFTTKPHGKGSGLGLSMAVGVMAQSGGRIEITSMEQEGTQVALIFPALPKDVTAFQSDLLQGQGGGVFEIVHDKAG
ncbi:MAG: ATP-binding protein [Marinovum sp.]|nr:ATP-binding protein [Marinovum sp.]